MGWVYRIEELVLTGSGRADEYEHEVEESASSEAEMRARGPQRRVRIGKKSREADY